jgi:hypothetical protein
MPFMPLPLVSIDRSPLLHVETTIWLAAKPVGRDLGHRRRVDRADVLAHLPRRRAGGAPTTALRSLRPAAPARDSGFLSRWNKESHFFPPQPRGAVRSRFHLISSLFLVLFNKPHKYGDTTKVRYNSLE